MALILLVLAAADPESTARNRAEVERLRGAVASETQLQAYDLLDELVYGWTREPLFPAPESVVLASMTVPVSMGTGLQSLLENHFSRVVLKHPETHLRLVHCASCTQVIVHSGAEGTVISRGYDSPEVLGRFRDSGESIHALFIDLEAEGAALVLRARVTTLEPELPIVFAKTLSTTTGTPALLRDGERLTSAEDAREEYLATLEGRSRWQFATRVTTRRYATEATNDTASVAPFVWFNAGAEFALNDSRSWVAGLNLGFSRGAQEAHTAWQFQARMARLLGRSSSLTRPDIYLFVAGGETLIRGPTALVFRDTATPTTEDILGQVVGAQPQSSFFSWAAGLEFRIKNRLGFSVFAETSPGLRNSSSIGSYASGVQSIGAEISFWL